LNKAAPGGCWLFTGYLNPKGYGTLHFRGRPHLTHRIAWTLFRGEIPPDQCVLHRCDVPACCNPDHLFLGTLTDNNRDMLAKGHHVKAAQTHCINGHPLSGGNLYMIPWGDGIGLRRCRECHRRRNNEYYQKRKRA
jgi:HNH endonuclease